MINIIRNEDCTGCSACFDICGPKAIRLETDIEGFWYPTVNLDLCTDCGLCEKICPVLHINELKTDRKEEVDFFASYITDNEVRKESTSGGLFSALADHMYDQGGYVGGAVYTEEFNVKHIISNHREDLLRIRGSKHYQSVTTGLFESVKKLLISGEKVLVCGAPCQVAGLSLFLGKEYENLITIDFICLGINSPKIFKKHLESLENRFGAKAISVQGKNKDLGWSKLSYKIKFANNKTYLREGRKDNFTRGFIETHCTCRPACYECKFKGFPRISDITLGDFWGIENVDSSMDDNMGTSVVLLNSLKGKTYFESIKDKVISRKVELSDVLPANLALIDSMPLPKIDRVAFYKDLDSVSFDKVVNKYYPLKKNMKLIKGFRVVQIFLSQMKFHPKPYLQLVWINFMRKKSKTGFLQKKLFIPAKYVVLDIHKQAQLNFNGLMLFGYKRIRGSKLESRLAVEGNASFTIEKGSITAYYGCDILVFNGASLTFRGSATLNQNVQIICMDKITIGDDVLISRDVVIRDNDGGHKVLTEGYKKTVPVIIGNHVWIGQGAMIMKGVTIGDGAIIGAGAWIVTNVKPKAVVMGDPARTIQKNIEWIH